MDEDWLPLSASALVVGAVGLSLATLMSTAAGTTAETLDLVRYDDGRWLIVATLYFLAAVTLILGMPCLLRSVPGRGRRLALVAVVPLSLGFVGTAGYAMLLVFFRSLVVTRVVVDQDLAGLSTEAGLTVFLIVWVLGFLVGELLLALALLRAGRAAPRWIPLMLLAHLATVAVSAAMPDWWGKATIVLLTLPLAGLAIRTVQRSARVSHRSAVVGRAGLTR